MVEFTDVWLYGIAPVFVAAATWTGARNYDKSNDRLDAAGHIGLCLAAAAAWPFCLLGAVLYTPYYVGGYVRSEIEDHKTMKLVRNRLKRLQEAQEIDEHMKDVNEHLARERGDFELNIDESDFAK